MVADFDSLQQLRLWLRRGPRKAMSQFVSMLRTAVLVGDRMYLDRNQLLDGICFLALGPGGVARVLGLEPGDHLPLVMGCSPSGPSPHGSTGESPGIDIDAQVAAVRHPGFCSASRIAVVMTRDGGTGATALEDGPTRDLWEVFRDIPRDPLDEDTDGWFVGMEDLGPEDLEPARDAWAETLRSGRMGAVVWPSLPQVPAPSFWSTPGSLGQPDADATRAIAELRSWSEGSTGEGEGEGEGEGDRAAGLGRPPAGARPLGQGQALRRGDVVAHLADLVRSEDRDTPAVAADPLHPEAGPPTTDRFRWTRRQARAALRWWSLLYHDAVLDAHWGQRDHPSQQVVRLAFWDTGRPVAPTGTGGGGVAGGGRHGDGGGSRGDGDGDMADPAARDQTTLVQAAREQAVEVQWGLRIARRSRWRFLLDRLAGRRLRLPPRTRRALTADLDRPGLPGWLRRLLGGIDHRRGTSAPRIRIEGEVIQALEGMDPVSYRILRRNTLVRKVSAGGGATMRDWFDVALAVRDAEPEEVSWGRRTGVAFIRFSVLLVAAVLLALNGAGIIPARTSVEVVLWTVLAGAAAFPIDECLALVSMRPAAMTSTIRIREADG